MKGLIRSLCATLIGGTAFIMLPRAGVLAASQELIGFLSLLMAGLLPAMTLTATILRGDRFSMSRVDEYASALRVQLRFWAVLFGAATVATAGIVIAKMFSAENVSLSFYISGLHITHTAIADVSLMLAGGGLGIVLARLYAAYQGLQSLLSLNITMAQIESKARNQAALDALAAEFGTLENPTEYGSTKGP